MPPPLPRRTVAPSALVLCALVSAYAARPARADEHPAAEADALVTEGARLGAEGRLEEAILRFKAAEARFPRALHDCNVGLAYARLGRLPQAHWFLSRCQRRATEPLPEWVAPRLETTLSQLRAGPYAPVRVETSPQPAPVTISTFAPDESVSTPADVWLPQAMEVVLTARTVDDAARGEARVRLPSPAPTRVLVEVRPSSPAPVPASLPVPAPSPEAPFLAEPVTPAESSPPRWPWWLTAGGGLAVVGGGLALANAAALADDARAASSAGRYDDLRDRAELRWGVGWLLVGAGAVALGVGLTQAPWGSEDAAPE